MMVTAVSKTKPSPSQFMPLVVRLHVCYSRVLSGFDLMNPRCKETSAGVLLI